MRWSSACPKPCGSTSRPAATEMHGRDARVTMVAMLNIRGAMTAMVTPFRDGKVDETRLRQQIEYQISQGIDGLVPVGTTGESPTLDFPEHERVIQITVTVANRRVPVIAGVGGNATTEALELHGFAKKVGCDAGLSVNPYYN